MDNEAPVSITSSSASAPPATSNLEGSAATPPSRRNLDVEFEVADSSCSEYVVSDSEESEHHDAIDVATDADNKEDLPDIYADPNIVLVSENPDDYTRLDSDDDNDGASVYSEDDDLGPAEAAAEDASIAPDLHFDSSFTFLRLAGAENKTGLYGVTRITAEQVEVMAPRVVKYYQTYMGGVDVYDQLRLQRYFLQMSRRYKKYYKSLFLGLIDLAIINACILYNCRRAADGKPKLLHVQFLKRLHLELIQLKPDDSKKMLRNHSVQPTPTKQRQSAIKHVPVWTDEWRKGNSDATRKRRQRACKVCSVLKGTNEPWGGETTYYCAECKLETASKSMDTLCIPH
ncbi:PiggyBac transposable element-derived protein [Phytophthora cactorum]|nr:PiggyBac transposable element-derived protein [Phytophthora cactorum]